MFLRSWTCILPHLFPVVVFSPRWRSLALANGHNLGGVARKKRCSVRIRVSVRTYKTLERGESYLLKRKPDTGLPRFISESPLARKSRRTGTLIIVANDNRFLSSVDIFIKYVKYNCVVRIATRSFEAFTYDNPETTFPHIGYMVSKKMNLEFSTFM